MPLSTAVLWGMRTPLFACIELMPTQAAITPWFSRSLPHMVVVRSISAGLLQQLRVGAEPGESKETFASNTQQGSRKINHRWVVLCACVHVLLYP